MTNSFLFKLIKLIMKCAAIVKNSQKKIRKNLFLRCPKIRTFYTDLQSWLKSAINIEISLSEREILFAYNGKNFLENYIYVLIKYFIYQNNFSTKMVTVQDFVTQ